jgi:rare lipoprotein A (peptidoglycan hydrolase)
MPFRRFASLVAALLIAACGGSPYREPPRGAAPAAPPPASGKYYLDDGPGLSPPPNLDAVPDAVPRIEPLHRAANRPYAVLGREYVPATSLKPYRERGIASWYGRKFHGQKTSIGETYDMYAMTAAHPTLPLPSYARVTNVMSGKSVIVRVNDRGPFLHDRIIDLSYVAAHRLGIAQNGSGEVAASEPAAARRGRIGSRRHGTVRTAGHWCTTVGHARRSAGCIGRRRLFGAARRVCKFCKRDGVPRACAEPTDDGTGRSENSPGGWTLSRLYRPLPCPRRSRARRGTHHAGIRIRDFCRAALSTPL